MLDALIPEIIAVDKAHIEAPVLEIPLVVCRLHRYVQAAGIRPYAGSKTDQFNGTIYVGCIHAEIVFLRNVVSAIAKSRAGRF